jgi:hypothetical protein
MEKNVHPPSLFLFRILTPLVKIGADIKSDHQQRGLVKLRT